MYYLERSVKRQKYYMWIQFRLCALNAAVVICFLLAGGIWGMFSLMAMLLNFYFIVIYWKELGHMEQKLVDDKSNTKEWEKTQKWLKIDQKRQNRLIKH